MKSRIALAATVLLAAVAAVGVGSGVGSGVLSPRSASAEAPSASAGTDVRPTAKVERRTLAERTTVTGTLGYPSAAVLKGGTPGTLTGLPAEGDIIERGQPTYEVDGRPGGILLYGDRPSWRSLGLRSAAGADILQLKQNLRALGFLKGTTELGSKWDAATTAAVKAWQKSLAVKPTGSLPLGSIVFRSGPFRVGTRTATLGDNVGPGSALYDTTGVRQQVSAELKADLRRLVKIGDGVDLLLPGGVRATGRIRSVGAVAHASSDPQGGSTVTLVVDVDDTSVTAGFDESSVSIETTTQLRKDVLAVPVSALLALRGGGYAVEVIRGATTELVGVQPGQFADGYVEITGSALVAGDSVVVAE